MKNTKKIIIVSILFLIANFSVKAQLSTRLNDSSIIVIGTRPVEGNFGFYLGASYQEIQDMIDKDVEITGIPLLNFKYYYSNNIVFGIGIKSYKKNEILNGKLPEDVIGQIQDTHIKNDFLFSPRIEYHFANTNIIDVYGCVGIPIGWESNTVNEAVKYSTFGDYTSSSVEKTSLVYGLNAGIGFQAFIADLPFAIGLELSVRGYGYSNLSYKHEDEYSIGGVVSSQTYYTTGNENLINYTHYEELTYRKFDLGSDVRITLNYFFTR